MWLLVSSLHLRFCHSQVDPSIPFHLAGCRRCPYDAALAVSTRLPVPLCCLVFKWETHTAFSLLYFSVYIKWNNRFFDECYKAYVDGRAEKDPSEGWYQGELGFFDYYIIPLAKKLESCGVFGVSSDECLNYAKANRREWELKGKTIVELYVKEFNAKNGRKTEAPSS